MSEYLLRQIIRQEIANIIRKVDPDPANPAPDLQADIERSARVIWNAIRAEYGIDQHLLEE